MAKADLAPDDGDEDGGGGAPWLATFADLSTLLLTFFVLLLSFANMDVVEFKMMLGSVRDAMGVQHEHPGRIMGLTTSVVEFSKRESTKNLDILEQEMIVKVQQFIQKNNLEGSVTVSQGDRGVIVQVREQLLFRVGRARLRKGAGRALSIIADLSRAVDLPLWIEGHTDDRPIRTLRFPSNWELSAARAAAALRFLTNEKKVDRDRIRIGGYADTKPIASNDTPEGRRKNRRVEFVFVRPAKRELEQARREHAERQGAAAADDAPAVAPPAGSLPAPGGAGPPVIELDLRREHREAERKRLQARRAAAAAATATVTAGPE